MRAPDFWNRPKDKRGFLPYLLWPLSRIADGLTRLRVARGPEFRASIPVICVGNINIGGTGKTPAAIAIAQQLSADGIKAHFVTRGHGGSLRGPVLADEKTMTAEQTGDEALLLAAFGPTWIAENRADGMRSAEQNGADVVILDDGHQNPSVKKDISIVVVDAQTGFGNGFVFPAGPLREDIQAGLARADILLSVGSDEDQMAFQQNWHFETKEGPINIAGELVPLEMGMDWNGQRVMPFAGIGRPQKFFATLRGLGAELVNETALDDHQPLSLALLKRLSTSADAANAQLVTTEKDAVRLPSQYRSQVLSLPVRMKIEGMAEITSRISKLLKS